MNLKRTLVSAVAALGMAASVMAPAALAQPTQSQDEGSDTTTAVVTVTTTGKFDVYFESTTLDMTDPTLTALTPDGEATGAFRLRYTDTLPNRPEFDVTVTATDFTSSSGTIPASGFKITRTVNVAQFQWGNGTDPTKNAYCWPTSPMYNADTCAAYPAPLADIGDIGFFQDGTYQGQSTEYWTANAPGLDSGPKVHYGRAGVGTHWSYGDVEVVLDVPAGTPGGDYSSTLTLEVVTGTEP
jgi:hypothetical protein